MIINKLSSKKVVLVAVKKYGSVLKYASDVSRADKKVILAAVKQCEYSLRDFILEMTSK